jgi:hypothetical protein
MSRRPTLLGLMALVAYFAFGMAAVRSDNDHLPLTFLALTVSGLCTTTLLAIYRRGAWAGFAVFGWGWFLTCQPHMANPPSGLVTYLMIKPVIRLPATIHTPLNLSAVLCLTCAVAGLAGALVGRLMADGSEADPPGVCRSPTEMNVSVEV